MARINVSKDPSGRIIVSFPMTLSSLQKLKPSMATDGILPRSIGVFKVYTHVTNKKIRDLANAYIERGVFPEKYLADAFHVAVASFYDISYVVSWNFEHLVKVKTRRSVNLVNILEGYREIEIVSPQEL